MSITATWGVMQKRARWWWSEWGYVFAVLGAAVTFLAVAFLILIPLVNRLTLPRELAEIERIRQDVAAVVPVEGEGAVRLAMEKNAEIASWRNYNRLWWSGWAVPDEWDHVEYIKVENRGQK